MHPSLPTPSIRQRRPRVPGGGALKESGETAEWTRDRPPLSSPRLRGDGGGPPVSEGLHRRDWRWPEGWIFGGWFVAMCVSIIAWLYRHDPALLAERYRRPGTGGQSRRDTLIVYLVMLGFIAWIVLMPLDARHFHWTPPLPLTLKVGGGALT